MEDGLGLSNIGRMLQRVVVGVEDRRLDGVDRTGTCVRSRNRGNGTITE